MNFNGVNVKEKVLKDGRWEATMWMEAREAAALMRESLEELGYVFERDATMKSFTKIMLIVPLPQFSYVFQFLVKEPSRFLVNIYDTQPKHGATLHHIEIKGIERKNLREVKKLLQTFAKRMERKPYKFPLYQRIQGGILSSEFLTAKRLWSIWGV
ncbi:MAG: hypothetical protein J7L88_01780 [Thermoplasmata archaeon]|nr:hypothetical protein [Thermoplasmata archaeon]